MAGVLTKPDCMHLRTKVIHASFLALGSLWTFKGGDQRKRSEARADFGPLTKTDQMSDEVKVLNLEHFVPSGSSFNAPIRHEFPEPVQSTKGFFFLDPRWIIIPEDAAMTYKVGLQTSTLSNLFPA